MPAVTRSQVLQMARESYDSILYPCLYEDFAWNWTDLTDPNHAWSPRAEEDNQRYIWFGLNRIDMNVIERVVMCEQIANGDCWTDCDRQAVMHVCNLLRHNAWFDKRYKIPTFDKNVWLELPDWLYYVWESLIADGTVVDDTFEPELSVHLVVGDDWDGSTIATEMSDLDNFSLESLDDVTAWQ